MTYKERKEALRSLAVKYQVYISKNNLSYSELNWFAEYFEANAKKSGLLREFRENGII